MLDNSLYVGDLISGSDLENEAYYLSATASEILKEIGMNLRKFKTNFIKLREMWESDNLVISEENIDSILKVVGLIWNTESDVLVLDANPFEECYINDPTKQTVLKMLLKIYDPLH